MKTKYKWFTVVLLYPGYCIEDYGADISVQWVKVKLRAPLQSEAGMSWINCWMADAAEKARKQCIEGNESGEFGDPPGSDLKVIAVFEGRRMCVADATWDL